MDDGEVEFSYHGVFPNSDLGTNFPVSTSMDTFMDEFLKKNTHTCTHTHTCNPPGPDNTHTHTCYHTHTQIFSTEDEDELGEKSESLPKKKKRPSGNREAVRKYREKKKAHTAYLEEEVQKLRLLNQQLLRRLQGQATLEAEVGRLRTLLFEFRGRIENELGSFPYQKPCSGNTKEGDCTVHPLHGGFNIRCETDVPCLHAPLGPSQTVGGQNGDVTRWEGVCEIANPDCQGFKVDGDLSQHSLSPERAVTSVDCVIPNAMTSAENLITPSGLVSE
eukprot:Gb_32471 [translate_table: standard]